MGAKNAKIVTIDDVQKRAPEEYKRLARVWNRVSRDGVNRDCFNREVFEKFSGDTPPAVMKRFFDACDTNGNGLLDGEEFVSGMFILLKGTNTERIYFSYRLYDTSGNGSVTVRDIVHTLSHINPVTKLQLNRLVDTLKDNNYSSQDPIPPDLYLKVASLSAHTWLWNWLLNFVPEASKPKAGSGANTATAAAAAPSNSAAGPNSAIAAPTDDGSGGDDPSSAWLNSRRVLSTSSGFTEFELSSIERCYRTIGTHAAVQAALAAVSTQGNSSLNGTTSGGDGRIPIAAFNKLFQHNAIAPPAVSDQFVSRLMSAMDSDGDGCIAFHEFVAGLSIVCSGGGRVVSHALTTKERLAFVFRMFDLDRDGVLAKSECQALCVILNAQFALPLNTAFPQPAALTTAASDATAPVATPTAASTSFAALCDRITISHQPLACEEFIKLVQDDTNMLAFLIELDAVCSTRFGVPPPTPIHERRLVKALVAASSRSIRVGQEYYVLSNRWFTRWKQYVQYDASSMAAAAAANAVTASSAADIKSPPASLTAIATSTPSASQRPSISASNSRPSSAAAVRPVTAPAKSKSPYSPHASAVPAVAMTPTAAPRGSVSSAADSTARPGPIDNSELLAEKLDTSAAATAAATAGTTALALRRGLSLGRDCVVVPEPVWTALQNWYGGGPALPRFIVPGLEPLTPKPTTPATTPAAAAASKEPALTADLYPYALTLILTHLKDRRATFLCSRIGKLRELHSRVCDTFRLTPANVRVWARPASDGTGGMRSRLLVGPPLPAPSTGGKASAYPAVPNPAIYTAADALTLSDVGVSERTDLVVESRLPDGSWRINSRILPREIDAPASDDTGLPPDVNTIPVDSRGLISRRTGLCGLENLGNTCFLNSAMQAVSHTRPLADYFLSDLYMSELVAEVPNAKNGAVAVELASLLKVMWSAKSGACIAPKQFKWMLGKFHSNFSGYAQQDAEELLRFVFSELHDSLNRSAAFKAAEDEAKAKAKREGRKYVPAGSAASDGKVVVKKVKSTLCCQAAARKPAPAPAVASPPASGSTTPPLSAAAAPAIINDAKQQTTAAPATAAVAATTAATVAPTAVAPAVASPDSATAAAPVPEAPCGWQSSTFQPYSTLPLNLPPPTPAANAAAGGSGDSKSSTPLTVFPYEVLVVFLPKSQHVPYATAPASNSSSQPATPSKVPEPVAGTEPATPNTSIATATTPTAASASPTEAATVTASANGSPATPTAAAASSAAAATSDAAPLTPIAVPEPTAAAAPTPAAAPTATPTLAVPVSNGVSGGVSGGADSKRDFVADSSPSGFFASPHGGSNSLGDRDHFGRHRMHYPLPITKLTTVEDVIHDISALTGIPPNRLLLADVYHNFVFSLITDHSARAISFAHNTRLVAYELPTNAATIPASVIAPPDPNDVAAAIAAGTPVPRQLVSIPIYVKFLHRHLVRSGFDTANGDDKFFLINNSSVKLFATPFILLLPSLVGWEPLYEAVWQRIAHFVSPAYKYEPVVSRPFKLRMTNRSGTACRRCPWIRGCLGCDLNPDPTHSAAILELREIGTVTIDFDRDWLMQYFDPVAANATRQGAGFETPPTAAAPDAKSDGTTAPTASAGSGSGVPTISLTACLDEFIKAERLTAKCERCAGTEVVPGSSPAPAGAAATPAANATPTSSAPNSTASTPVATAAPAVVVTTTNGSGATPPGTVTAATANGAKPAAAGPKPGSASPFTKQLSLWNAPRVLIVQLKRFEYDGSKNDARVDFPITGLDLAPYIGQPPTAVSTIYDLYAVVNHFGSTGAGHYMASIRTSVEPLPPVPLSATPGTAAATDSKQSPAPSRRTATSGASAGTWYCFDDHSVRELDESQLREPAHTGAAYLLFYQRRDAVPLPTALSSSADTPSFGASMDDLMRGWALSDRERRALRSYPGSAAHTKKKEQLKTLQADGNCVIL